MKKIAILLAAILLSSCSPTKDVVDYDLFKNELNESIQEGFPGADYVVK